MATSFDTAPAAPDAMLPTPPAASGAAVTREHGMDALRALALGLGLVLHAAVAFVPAEQSNGWPLVDRSTSPAFSLIVVIHMFRMTVFFVVAGYFARLILLRNGWRQFLLDRARRILAPFGLGALLLLPLAALAFYVGAQRSGRPLPEQAGAAGPQLMHLWFLWLLCWFYPMLLGARALAGMLGPRPGRLADRADLLVRRACTSMWGAAFLALPTVLVVLGQGAPPYAWVGIPAPDTLGIPNLTALAGYGSAFAFGYLLHRQRNLLDELAARGRRLLCVAVLATGAWGVLAIRHRLPGPAAAFLPVGQVLLYCVAGWYYTVGLIGLTTRHFTTANPWRRYLVDASYWVYLIHFPVILWLETAVIRLDWPSAIKFALVLAGATLLSLLSYHYLVRSTRIGLILNGRISPRRPLLQVLRHPD